MKLSIQHAGQNSFNYEYFMGEHRINNTDEEKELAAMTQNHEDKSTSVHQTPAEIENHV